MWMDGFCPLYIFMSAKKKGPRERGRKEVSRWMNEANEWPSRVEGCSSELLLLIHSMEYTLVHLYVLCHWRQVVKSDTSNSGSELIECKFTECICLAVTLFYLERIDHSTCSLCVCLWIYILYSLRLQVAELLCVSLSKWLSRHLICLCGSFECLCVCATGNCYIWVSKFNQCQET